MFAITVDMLLGTYRADPSGLAPTGQMTTGEWPPAPLRLLAALVAADGTRDRSRHTTGEELAFLEHCDPPLVYASPSEEVHHQRLESRFVVSQTGGPAKGKAHQEYQARVGVEVRPGVRAAPKQPRVTFVWAEDPSTSVLEGLRLRAARIGYLGTADSPVQVQVSTSIDTSHLGDPYEPAADGDLTLGVPRPGVVAAMDAHYDRWCAEGASVNRSQSPGLRRLAVYRSPGTRPQTHRPRPTILWFVLDRSLPGRRITAVTTTLKAALLDRYERIVGEPPAVLHGHVDTDEPYELASFLALPDAGHGNARGAIGGVAVVVPASTPDDVIAGCRDALHGLDELVGPAFKRGVRPWAGEERPRAVHPNRWTGPGATEWVTVFPALHERRRKPVTVEEVGRWCRHSGLPEPTAVRSTRTPLVAGGVDLAPSEVNRPDSPPRPYSHLHLVFAEPVQGPVVIGAGRHRGLGLCIPMPKAKR